GTFGKAQRAEPSDFDFPAAIEIRRTSQRTALAGEVDKARGDRDGAVLNDALAERIENDKRQIRAEIGQALIEQRVGLRTRWAGGRTGFAARGFDEGGVPDGQRAGINRG